MLYWVAVNHNIHVPFSCFHGIDPNCQPPTVRLLLTQLSCLCFLFLVWNFSLGLLHKILGKQVWQSLDHAQTVPLEIHEIYDTGMKFGKKWWPKVQDLSQGCHTMTKQWNPQSTSMTEKFNQMYIENRKCRAPGLSPWVLIGVGKGRCFPIKVAGVIVTPKISKICGLVLLRVRWSKNLIQNLSFNNLPYRCCFQSYQFEVHKTCVQQQWGNPPLAPLHQL